MNEKTDARQAASPAPNAPDYHDLRMAAEWASAVRGPRIHFDYEPGWGQMRISPIRTYPSETAPNAVRPRVMAVEIRIGEQSLCLPGDEYGALLWGESTVEKFLFAYYASVAAQEAPGFLARLMGAWYDYPGRVMQVCAVAVRYGRDFTRGGLVLDDTVRLVCQVGPGSPLQLMSLGELAQAFPRGGLRFPTSKREQMLQEHQGWKVTSVPDNVVTREAAEFVSGMRGRYVSLVLKDGTLTPWVFPSDVPAATLEDTVIGSVAPLVRGDRPEPSEVTVWVGEHCKRLVNGTKDSADVPDSMFWTDQAVEDLVLPYYASVKGRHAPFYITMLMGKWNGLIPAASSDSQYAAATLREMVAGAEVVSTVFAVTHMPRSEYVTDATIGNGEEAPKSARLEHRTRLLSRDSGHFGDDPLFAGEKAGG